MIEFFDSAFNGPGAAANHASNVSDPAMPSLHRLHRGESTPILLVQCRGKISESLLSRSTFNWYRPPWPRQI
jgi:hypothetical protein